MSFYVVGDYFYEKKIIFFRIVYDFKFMIRMFKSIFQNQ